ncbi:hypothetical protein D3C72_1704480 [compost metagenome]
MLAKARQVPYQVRNAGIACVGAHPGIGIGQPRLQDTVRFGNADLLPLRGIDSRRIGCDPGDEHTALLADIFNEPRTGFLGDQHRRTRHMHVVDRNEPCGTKALAEGHQDLHGLLDSEALVPVQHPGFFFSQQHTCVSMLEARVALERYWGGIDALILVLDLDQKKR